MTKYSLDACALIAFVDNEDGAEIVEGVFNRAAAGEAAIYMRAINLLEVIYGFRPKKTDAEMTELWQDIRTLPIKIIREISDSIINEAARLKSLYKMSLADSIGLATAVELSAQFVTSDHKELEPIERHEPISFLWLPAKPRK
jgi:predicted nucleic acid-binding protein